MQIYYIFVVALLVIKLFWINIEQIFDKYYLLYIWVFEI